MSFPKINYVWIKENKDNLYDYFMAFNRKSKNWENKYDYYGLEYESFVGDAVVINFYKGNSFVLKQDVLNSVIDDPKNPLSYECYLKWLRDNKINSIIK